MSDVSYRQLIGSDLEDLKTLRNLYIEVFGESFPSVDNGYLNNLLNDKDVLFFVAELDNKIVGGLTAYVLPSIYGAHNEVYIYDVAVLEAYQRHGIGSGLISTMKDYCAKNGIKSMFVQADEEDKHAQSFYLKNGGKEADVRHYDFQIPS